VGGLESDDTAVRCRYADGSTGIGTNSPVTELRCDSGRRPTRRAAGVVSGIPRIANRAEIADQRTGAVGEFVQVQLAQQNRTGSFKATNDLSVLCRNAIFE